LGYIRIKWPNLRFAIPSKYVPFSNFWCGLHARIKFNFSGKLNDGVNFYTCQVMGHSA